MRNRMEPGRLTLTPAPLPGRERGSPTRQMRTNAAYRGRLFPLPEWQWTPHLHRPELELHCAENYDLPMVMRGKGLATKRVACELRPLV